MRGVDDDEELDVSDSVVNWSVGGSTNEVDSVSFDIAHAVITAPAPTMSAALAGSARRRRRRTP
ncbi:hypothetical protein ABLE92_08325 [Gordonia sp. VNQ95]|uniref:hypothetical protein n=1 Tax=Gordonia sp. VNQ95 TaxID=3156619 RepID=UPI0032B34737